MYYKDNSDTPHYYSGDNQPLEEYPDWTESIELATRFFTEEGAIECIDSLLKLPSRRHLVHKVLAIYVNPD